jgi:ATP synthase protein I
MVSRNRYLRERWAALTQCGHLFRFRADQPGRGGDVADDKTSPMPQPDDRPHEALHRLGEELQAFEAERTRPASSRAARAVGEGYRLLAELIGGVLAGVGFGWLVDQFAHTAPWGMAVGVSLGAGLSVFMAVRTAVRMGRNTLDEGPPIGPAPLDDDED